MAATTSDQLSFYTTQGHFTHPGRFVSALDSVPPTSNTKDLVKSVATIIHNTVVHEFHLKWIYGISRPEGVNREVHTHSVPEMLEVVKSKRGCNNKDVLKGEGWGAEKCAWINCRHFSLLMVSLLRHHGIPARTRCGFGRYFPGVEHEFWYDHWILEYWLAEERRWVQVDPELSPIVVERIGFKFDPLDLPPGEFICAAEARRMVQEGKASADVFGLPEPGLTGRYMIVGNVYRDFWALNNLEVLPWETFKPGPDRDMEEDPADIPEVKPTFERILELTAAASLSVDDPNSKSNFKELRRLGTEGVAKVGGLDQIFDLRTEKLVSCNDVGV